eukprot:5169133-Alexandrium_andersonii.AAC.1
MLVGDQWQSHRVMTAQPVRSALASGGEPCCYGRKASHENAGEGAQQYPGAEERNASGPAAREACGPPAP